MKQTNSSIFWLIPAAFFLVAATLNLLSCLTGWTTLFGIVKPVLLPLCALTTLSALLTGGPFARRAAALLLAAQLFGMTGDMLLIGEGFPFFAGGMGAFLLGHVCYLTLFGGAFWRGMGWKSWAVAAPVMAGLVAGLVLAIGIHGALLGPMVVYGCALMLLMFSGLCGVLRKGAAWWPVLAGGVLFTFSDGLIALRTFRLEETPVLGFTIMATYLAAQVLLAVGGVRLARHSAE